MYTQLINPEYHRRRTARGAAEGRAGRQWRETQEIGRTAERNMRARGVMKLQREGPRGAVNGGRRGGKRWNEVNVRAAAIAREGRTILSCGLQR